MGSGLAEGETPEKLLLEQGTPGVDRMEKSGVQDPGKRRKI